MDMIRLTGRAFLDEEGIFNCECVELDIMTCANSLQDLISASMNMIDAYFMACVKDRTVLAEVRRLVGRPDWNGSAVDICFEVKLDNGVAPVRSSIRSEATIQLSAGA